MAGYDSAITIFSPNGNLLQVEYSMEAVNMGQCSAAVKCKDGIVFAVEKKSFKKLQDSSSIKKIHMIDENVCAAFSGLNSDGRILVNNARLKAQSYRLDYEDDPSIEFMSRYISQVVQKYTQKGGARPFGLSMFVAGFDREHQPKLYLIEPSGMITSWKAHAIG
jgi:20S proteasome subunit alpha 4